MKFTLVSIIMFLYGSVFSQVLINEVMYAPQISSNEWFELVNISDSSVNLMNWKWRDAASGNPVRTITSVNALLSPGQFAVVCQDSVQFKNQFPYVIGRIIQSQGWNSLNNSGNENVVIYNSYGVISDSLTYNNNWGGNSGFSLERKSLSVITNIQSNWGTCIDTSKGTPLRKNSISPYLFDLKMSSFNISPVSPFVGDTLFLKFVVKNTGLNALNSFNLKIFNDINFDSIPAVSELIISIPFSGILNSGDSASFTHLIFPPDSGRKQFIGLADFPQDSNYSDNKIVKSVYVRSVNVTGNIIFNEIMHSPSNNEPEWVEIFNKTGNPVNLKNWKISDSSSFSSPVLIIGSDKIINPDEFFVIAKSSSIINFHPSFDTTKLIIVSSLPSLNNDRDIVYLFDPNLNLVDFVPYKSSWGGNNGYSLERKSYLSSSSDSLNWFTSLDCEKSTPGRINSFSSLQSYAKNSIVINEVMYDPFVNESEWLELINVSPDNIYLNGWSLSSSNNKFSLFDTCTLVLAPNGFLVLSSDSSIYNRFSYLRENNIKVVKNSSLVLKNEGDCLKIKDALSNVIDSICYSPSWHNRNLASSKGISLERINPFISGNSRSNWNSCTMPSGGTPGLKNSIYTASVELSSSMNISPNPFSPDGDGFQDFTIINYKLKSAVSQIRIKIFDVKGRLVRTLINNSVSGSEASVIFDGKGDNGENLRIGIYIVFLESINDIGGTVEQIKSTLVIAAKL